MRDDLEYDPEMEDFSDAQSEPDWETDETFEDDADFEEALYLDEADRGSSTKRRYNTARASKRRDNDKVLRKSRRSAHADGKRRARQAMRAKIRHLKPRLGRTADRALQRRVRDRSARTSLVRSFLQQVSLRAMDMAARKAPNAITAPQIIRFPFQLVLTSAAVEAARQSGLIDEREARNWAEVIFNAIGIADMAVRIGAGLIREADAYAISDDFSDEEDYADFATGEDGFEDLPGGGAEDFAEDEMFDPEGELPSARRAGDRIAVSRALRNAARQLLRVERRLMEQR
ncbi:hypothetical protein [Thioclava sp.]|uniref:hypothetical protein n=1 Tax=Thioclava sp. TaxID=1933450 RepID=UPI003AA823A5